MEQEAHHNVGIGETSRLLIRKSYRSSSREKSEDGFDTALDLMHSKPFRPFSNFDECRSEAAGDVISGMTLDYVGTDVSASLGDCRLNSARIIQLFVRTQPFCALLRSI